MRVPGIMLVCLLAGACSSPTTQAGAQTPSSAVTLYEGATLIDGETGQARPNAAFIVEAGRIGQVGAKGQIKLPSGATRVDLSGKTVIPALVSAHIHIGLLDGNDF